MIKLYLGGSKTPKMSFQLESGPENDPGEVWNTSAVLREQCVKKRIPRVTNPTLLDQTWCLNRSVSSVFTLCGSKHLAGKFYSTKNLMIMSWGPSLVTLTGAWDSGTPR